MFFQKSPDEDAENAKGALNSGNGKKSFEEIKKMESSRTGNVKKDKT